MKTFDELYLILIAVAFLVTAPYWVVDVVIFLHNKYDKNSYKTKRRDCKKNDNSKDFF